IDLSADDFTIPTDQVWLIKKVYAQGRLPDTRPLRIHIQKAHVKIFNDSLGYPTKNELYSTSVTLPYEDRSNRNLMLTLPEPVLLAAGRYWFSVYVEFYERENYNDEIWFWIGTDSVKGTQSQMCNRCNEPQSYWEPNFEGGVDGRYDLVFTLFGIDTHIPADSLAPEAPVANLASFVSATSFTANWQPVEDATHYELDVFNIQDSVSLPGYENKIVNGTSQDVTGTKSYRRYFYVVRAVNDSVASENSNAIRVAHIKNLTLRTVCSDTPTVYRRWKVINNNPFPIPVTWSVLNTTQSGIHIADVGESFFVTETVSGLNKTMIAWYDDEQVQHISVKSSTYNPCQSDKMIASGRRNLEEELNEEESPFMVAVYPNPVKDKLIMLLSTPLEGMVSIEMFNLNGQRVYAKEALGNTIQEIDASSFSPGIFILKAKQGQYQRAIKIVKQ
ncbi:MAG TPA: T9SS type A sorting domain-containing protein, partial [Ohtaekwangia sp.]|nr:T9SS type A sorting domain-containing protein [Ohtaekwangia sp.]